MGLPTIYTPAIVGRQRTIDGRTVTDGQKRLYDHLTKRAGENGDCFPGFANIADQLGKSERQVRYDLGALEAFGLIRHEKRLNRRSNTYFFIWHAIFERQSTATQNDRSCPKPEFERQSTATQNDPAEEGFERQDLPFEWQSTADLSGNGLPPNLSIESLQELNGTQRRASVGRGMVENQGDQPPAAARSTQALKTNPGEANEPTETHCEVITAVLGGFHVKIFPPEIVPELIKLAAEKGVSNRGLAEFIRYKCGSGCVEVASFFRRAIGEDIPTWAKKNGSMLDRMGGLIRAERPPDQVVDQQAASALDPACDRPPYVSELTEPLRPCGACRESGYRLNRQGELDVSVVWCQCPCALRMQDERGHEWVDGETRKRREEIRILVERGERAQAEQDLKFAAFAASKTAKAAKAVRTETTLLHPESPRDGVSGLRRVTQADFDQVTAQSWRTARKNPEREMCSVA
jgi:hypothetical protein